LLNLAERASPAERPILSHLVLKSSNGGPFSGIAFPILFCTQSRAETWVKAWIGSRIKQAFPRRLLPSKTVKALISERECLNPASIFTVSSTANFFCWLTIATDRNRKKLFLNQQVESIFG
jgi:hypothetical protein